VPRSLPLHIQFTVGINYHNRQDMKKHLFTGSIFLAYLLFFSNFSAIGVVMDTRLFVVILSLITLAALIIYVYKVRRPYSYFLLFFSLAVTFLSIKEYFLTYTELFIAQNQMKAIAWLYFFMDREVNRERNTHFMPDNWLVTE